jgi:hypothetical protein
LTNDRFKNGGDGKAGGDQRTLKNIDEWTAEAHGWSIMVEKEIYEIGRMGVEEATRRWGEIEEGRRRGPESRKKSRKMDDWIAACRSG